MSDLSRYLEVEELEGRVVPTLLGQQLFPADYPWNQNISNAPVAANSAAIIAHIGNSKIHPDWGEDSASNGDSPLYGIPFNVVHGNSVAKVNVMIDNYPGESDILPVPIPANAVIEGDYQNGPNPNGGGYNANQRGDSHLIVWDEDHNIAYELFGVTRPSDPTLFPNTSGVELPHTDGQWHAAQETVWNMNTDTFRSLGDTSADAAGLSILAGLVRPDEGLPIAQGGQGAIDHALRFTLPSGDVAPQYIYPASHVVSDSAGADKLPFGARLRLANTPAIDALISGMQPEAQIIATAMQQYGLVLADIGSAMFVTGSSASVDANNNIQLTWNMNDVLGLEALTAADFQVVNLTPQVTGLSASSAAAGSTITVTGQNFSGAAGHLTVFFGSTPSPSVTFVADSHLTVVVPSGSGTVNVTVQSGVDETDPNNPNDNVNNPIFGYGISPVTSADQFSFNSQTISAANSAASFATSTVAPGNTDTLTIVVTDTTGNAVRGLPSSAFSFSFSNGNSAGTFGPVSETGTSSTYTTVFTATTAGTASTLTVTVSGTSLAVKPNVQVIATGSLDADHSYIQALYLDVLGRSASLPELDGWVTYLRGAANGSLYAVTTAIEGSQEAKTRLVNGWYASYLGRSPSNGEEQGWVTALMNGASEEQVQAGIMSSAEFGGRADSQFGNANANVNFIEALYEALLQRTPTTTEVNAWVAALPTLGRDAVALDFFDSLEHRMIVVSGYYVNLLHRPGSAADISTWSTGPYNLQTIRYYFESSQEFYNDSY